jgi:hypothetical protein
MSFLSKRVKQPDLDDWRKLVHLMEYLKADGNRPLILAADKTGILIWYIDAERVCPQLLWGSEVDHKKFD